MCSSGHQISYKSANLQIGTFVYISKIAAVMSVLSSMHHADLNIMAGHWLFSVLNCQMANHFPKWLGPLGQPYQRKYVDHAEMLQSGYYDIVVSIVANSNGKCIMQRGL